VLQLLQKQKQTHVLCAHGCAGAGASARQRLRLHFFNVAVITGSEGGRILRGKQSRTVILFIYAPCKQLSLSVSVVATVSSVR
jgi:hypothetical protein